MMVKYVFWESFCLYDDDAVIIYYNELQKRFDFVFVPSLFLFKRIKVFIFIKRPLNGVWKIILLFSEIIVILGVRAVKRTELCEIGSNSLYLIISIRRAEFIKKLSYYLTKKKKRR